MVLKNSLKNQKKIFNSTMNIFTKKHKKLTFLKNRKANSFLQKNIVNEALF